MLIRNLWLTPEKQRAVAITEEAEIMPESIVVDSLPVAADKRGNQKNQRALRLMKVRDENVNEPEPESRHNYDSCADLQLIKAVSLKIGDDRIQRLSQ